MDVFELYFVFVCCLVYVQLVLQFIFGDGFGVVDFVVQDDEGNFGEFFYCEEGVEFGFGFGEVFVVFCVNKKYDIVDFGEVVFLDMVSCEKLLVNVWCFCCVRL